MQLRSIISDDWKIILDIQEECYPGIVPESLEVLQSKWQLSPQTCFVIEDNHQTLGYCLAHPWELGTPPALEQKVQAKAQPNTLYLHDIALSAKAQGKGAGRLAFDKLVQGAADAALSSISLVAVQGADSYWLRQGFIRQKIDKSLESYTPDACYMVLEIS
ncbi:GNAT family N-acetyltransferase [Shewanella woodyi]|uniref:GCN5-related N-acetyltransferase n=1 Tax=Shewanella woodyi (strain ATCC 51908 / MS32) TaxID=392500 RepID=B1KGP6_SHEWM|nr:GNAT family N-acetyltransferase [Shewanella woodyi]ACA85374.1 GCN5-related N-acetyltransferase [Shewanella woodyi ATCC 51908]